jgi:hypothetical protein
MEKVSGHCGEQKALNSICWKNISAAPAEMARFTAGLSAGKAV